MFDQFNQFLFSLFNAAPGLSGWRLQLAVFAAEWVVLIVPVGLVLMWINGAPGQREAAVRALLAALVALTISKLIGLVWFHPRPFMIGLGQSYLHHAADSSFPSDHATGMFSVALALAICRLREARRFGMALLALGLAVAWARVFLGVHWPLDMIAAFIVSALAALLVNTDSGAAFAATLVEWMEGVYRRVLATPIARGWLRP
jgi:undecaprenyl-diphosphatase